MALYICVDVGHDGKRLPSNLPRLRTKFGVHKDTLMFQIILKKLSETQLNY